MATKLREGQINNTAKARAWRSGNQTIPHNTDTKVQLNAESYDVGSNFDSSTNYRFTAPVTGYYFVTGKVYWNDSATAQRRVISVRKNGSSVSGTENAYSNYNAMTVADVVYLEATQYLELYVYQATGGDLAVLGGAGTDQTYMTVHLLSI